MLDLTSALDLDCFGTSYGDARQHFLHRQRQLDPSLLRMTNSHAHPLPGPQQEPLACDVLQFGQSDTPQQLLVLISATHGVEGFAGSAIQCDCLPLLARLVEQHPQLGVVMIHAINPWGFAWLRRYDHEGIDLNRNFVDFGAPLPDNADYERLHQRLLSATDVDTAQLPRLWQDSDPATFTEIVTRGQYRHRDGLFFGGTAPSWSRRLLQQITTEPLFAAAQRIAVIDLHTGLGPYGYGEVINDHPPDSTGFRLAQAWYGNNAHSTVLGDSVSTLKQGLLDYHWHEVMGERGCFVTLEFGTYAIEQLFVSLLREHQLHNRLVQSGAQRDLTHESIVQLKQFFYPAERSWQQQVLFRGRQVIDLALTGLMQ